MLANLLSGKSFFIQIILGSLFFVLFFGQSYSESLIYDNIWGMVAFIAMVILCYLFFINSKLFKSPNLPIWFFIIWIFVFSGIFSQTRISVSLFVCTILFWRMVHAEERSDSKTYAFDVGVCLSISSFFYPPSFLLIGLILFNYLYMQSLNARIIILFILGLLFPFAAGIQILYLMDKMEWLYDIKNYFYFDFWNASALLWLVPVLVLILAAWFDHISHSGTQDINKRHIYFLFFLYFINWIIILVLFGGDNLNLLSAIGLPIALFIARYVQYQNSTIWKEILIWGFLAIMTGFYFRYEIIEIYFDLLGNVSF